MADIKLAFIVNQPQYKGETSRLAITHAMAYQTVEILLDDDDMVTPTICFVGKGVLGISKGQNAMDNYGFNTTELHVKNLLLVDMRVIVCKEDLEKYGISEDQMPDAEEMGADVTIEVLPFSEVIKVMEESRHVLFF